MKRTLLIFYTIIIYALAQLTWWAYRLIMAKPGSAAMVLSEGSVFIIIFLFGAYSLHKSLSMEKKPAGTKKEFFAFGNT